MCLIIRIPHQISFSDKIKENKMGGKCSSFGGKETFVQVLVRKTNTELRGRPMLRLDDWVKNFKGTVHVE
jgi:hypothetical protein